MKKRFYVPFLLTLLLAALAFPASSLAQEDRVRIDKSRIPAEANDAQGFVPSGWKIEEQVAGDLNGDSLPDYALKLVEDKPATDNGDLTERQRALVIVLKNKEGKLSSVGVADDLLQCTRCGGAFYGVVETPSNVKIEKGTLIVEQDHGSRNVTTLTYRFRYEPATSKMALIGFDLKDYDRLTAETVSESTNYLTGVRITSRGKGKRVSTSRKTIPTKKVYIEQVSNEGFEEAAAKRLGM